METNDYKWHFAAGSFGKLNGINTTEIDMFKTEAICNLTREHIQNSLDARKDENSPVVVEFVNELYPVSKIPGIDSLKDEVNKCIEYLDHINNNVDDEASKVMKNIRNSFNKNMINILAISDYNTQGVIGVKDYPYVVDKKRSKLTYLIKGNGSGGKVDAGGSKGVGKYSGFAASDAYTLFYNTYNIDEEKAHIGVSHIVSRIEDNKVTSGDGYYTTSEEKPKYEEFRFFKKNRETQEYGTDVFVIGFNGEDGWEKEMIRRVLENFMYAICNGDLIVRVGNINISVYDQDSKKNINRIKELIEEYASKENTINRNIRYQFDLINGNGEICEKDVVVPYEGKDYSFKLRVKKIPKANSSVCYGIRGPIYMLIKTIQVGSWPCAAMAVIDDLTLRNALTQAENSCHSEWSYKYVKDVTKIESIKNLITDMKSKIKEYVSEVMKDGTDEIEVEDSIEFISAIEDDDNSIDGNTESDDTGLDPSVQLKIERKEDRKKNKEEKMKAKDDNKELKEFLKEIEVIQSQSGDLTKDGEVDGHLDYGSTGGDQPSKIDHFDKDNDGNAEEGQGQKGAIDSTKKTDPKSADKVRVKIKAFIIPDPSKGEFILSAELINNVNGCKLSINKVDESGEATLVSVMSCASKNITLICENGKIKVPSGVDKIEMLGKLNSSEQFAAEVKTE